MEERYEGDAEFGLDPIGLEDEQVEDEIVLDEVPEEELSEEYEEENQEENESPEIKKLDKAQIRINRITKERYKAEDKAKRAIAEAEHWRKKYEISSQFSLRQTDLNANARLEKARADLIAAGEAGDLQAQADANIAIAAATADLQEISKEKMRAEYEEKTRQNYSPQYQEEPDTEMVQEWIQENDDWINPKSKNFDQELTQYIAQVDYQLVNELRAKNAAHLIGGYDYIETLENYKNAFLSNRNQQVRESQNTSSRRELSMKQARHSVSPVRTSGQTQYRRSVDLTPAERAMVEANSHIGLTEESFKRAKMEYLKKCREEEGRA